MSTTTDCLQAFKRHIARKLADCKSDIPLLTAALKADAMKAQPRECARIYQERTALVAQVVELQAVLDYLRDFEAELAYNAATATMLGEG